MPESKPSLKSRLTANGALVGTFVKTPSPIVVELLASTSLDLLCLDAEHAPFDRGDLDLCVLACRAAGMPVLIRIPSTSPEHVLNALDLGADGVIAPHITSAVQARELVRMAHFGAGGRGYAGSPRAANYTRRSMADHVGISRAETVVIAMIEDIEAVAEIDDIVAVEGLDGLFVGRADLTVALGKVDAYDPAVIEAVERVCAAAGEAGRPLGMFVPKVDDVAQWIGKGAGLFLLESDHSFLLRGADSLVQRFKAASAMKS